MNKCRLTLSRRLTAWALRRGGGTPLLLGIARDAPGITPAAKIRFDCCVQVPAPFEADGEIGCQRTPGGDHAITEYVGSWERDRYESIWNGLATCRRSTSSGCRRSRSTGRRRLARSTVSHAWRSPFPYQRAENGLIEHVPYRRRSSLISQLKS